MAHPKYPIGLQSFEGIRSEGSVYIDKTRFVGVLLRAAKYLFLGRPRRFGKSLFLSTLDAYFRGSRELFVGLDICRTETEWLEYPVIHIDFSRMDSSCPGSLRADMEETLRNIADSYDVDFGTAGSVALRFSNLIVNLYRKYGRKTVILVDEYDVPVHSIEKESDLYKENQLVLRSFFQQCKANDASIKFCMVTGVARFNQMSLFSGPNNFTDISMDPEFATICGFTRRELDSYCREGIETFAEAEGVDYDVLCDRLEQHYDGYRFTRGNEKVFNPLSILCALRERYFGNYWVSTGLTSVFVSRLADPKFDLPKLTTEWVDESELNKIYDSGDPLSLMFQTGYMTIADWRRHSARLRVPNQEVMEALTRDLIPAYMGRDEVEGVSVNRLLHKLEMSLLDGDVDMLLSVVDTVLANVAYHLFPNREDAIKQKENYYHTMVYLMFMMLKSNVMCEMSTRGGRSDMVAQTDKFVYIFEFKVDRAPDGTVEDAIRQIDERGYADAFRHSGKHIYKIGMVFSEVRRTVVASGYESVDTP